MAEPAFEGDAAFFDVVAQSTDNREHARQLRQVAEKYRTLARNGHSLRRSRREYWLDRAEECRTLSDQFQSPVCREQLARLAESYEIMASTYVEDSFPIHVTGVK